MHIFGLKSYRLWNTCKRNYYSFSWIFLKLSRCFCQGLKMCMKFGHNPQITFYPFFRCSNLVIFGLKAFIHGASCERSNFQFKMSSRCAYKSRSIMVYQC